MAIKAIVLDIGGVLEICDNNDFAPVFAKWKLDGQLDDVWAAGAVGTISIAEVEREIGERIGLNRAQVDELMGEFWAAYLGTLNVELYDYFKSLRPRYRTGIISNSFVGAREREHELYGFGDACDHIVYSHEAGVSKPDPSIYRMSWEALGVEPHEMIFVDDADAYLQGAQALGIPTVRMTTNTEVIMQIETFLELSV